MALPRLPRLTRTVLGSRGSRGRSTLLGLCAAAGLGAAGLGLPQLPGGGLPPGGGLLPAALAQGTPGLLEFRWDNTRDFRRLYFFVTNTARRRRADYFLILRPRDRQTAIMRLSVTIPSNFNATIDPQRVRLCTMQEGGMLSRTRCLEEIPATVELAEGGSALEIFPDTPVPDDSTIGVFMRLFNPADAGMFQFNALAQAPGDVPISGYLGSWVIQIDP